MMPGSIRIPVVDKPAGGRRWLRAGQQLRPARRATAPPYQPYPYQAPPQAVPGPPSSADGKLAQLKLLGELHESGVLTDDEFEREKQRILRG